MKRHAFLSWLFVLALLVGEGPVIRDANATDVRSVVRGAYVLYEPAPWENFDRSTMPIVVYLHGAPWITDPAGYDRMLTEIAASGCVVVLPIYGERDPTDPDFWRADEWYADALQTTNAALSDLAAHRAGWWSPPLRNLALVGHSLGGAFSLKMAADTNCWLLPPSRKLLARPIQIVLHDAAGYYFLPILHPDDPFWIEDLRSIHDSTELVLIAARESALADLNKGDVNASGIWSRAWHRSGSLASKRAYLADGRHFDVYGDGDYQLYVDVTVAALRRAVIDPAPHRRFDAWMQFVFTP